MDEGARHPADPERQVDGDHHVERPGWRSLFNFTTRPHIIPLLLALILSVASGIVIPALSIFLGKVFDCFTSFGAGTISGSDLLRKISMYGLALVGLGSASGLLNAGYFMFWILFGELQAKSARDKLFEGMLEKEMEWYDMRKSGIDTLISRLQTNVRELQLATSQPLGFAVQYAVTTLAALGVAFYTAWNLTLVTLATAPISALTLAWISARMQPSIEAQAKELTRASQLANNSILAIDTVKCFNGQDFQSWQYAQAVHKAARFYLIQARQNALQIGLIRLVTLGMFVQGFWYGSHLVDKGKKNPGQILTAFWACLMAAQAIEQILPQMIVLEKGRAAGATLKAALIQMERGRKVTNMVGCKTLGNCKGDIEIRNVSFTYPSRPDRLALDNTSFFFPAGETSFVIGRSGSGKSTLGNLLMGFYSPDSGEIMIDGNAIQTIDISWLRKNVTLVQQQSVLFNETIYKNIMFGIRNPEKTKQNTVRKAIELAGLRDTIQDLPQSLDTAVGNGGNAMSGGQKQRIAIARAHLRDTPILILDEATSALDHVSKARVMDAIRAWRREKTTIIITHDMSHIRDSDFAYVLDNGVIVQEGFRHALERLADGPLGIPQELNDLPLNKQLPSLPKERPQPCSSTTHSESPPASIISRDSMDIQVLPRKSYIPNVLSPRPADLETGRYSRSLVLPLSPTAFTFPLSRMSTTHRMSSSQPKHTDLQPIEAMDHLIPEVPPLPNEVELTEMKAVVPGQGTRKALGPSTPQRGTTMQSSTSGIRSPRTNGVAMPKHKHRLTKAEKERRVAPISQILSTIWPTLTWRKRIVLVCGFLCAAVHAGATPTFSWVFSKLLATFFSSNNHSQESLKWSISVLGVAVVDSSASYCMHYLLEYCGQAWIDTLRIQAMKRILDQPRAWFDRDKNDLARLTECLDRNAEEMRNLLGRFAGFVFVAVTMVVVAVTWSLVVSWKLTLVGLASGPFMYGVTRAFEAVSGKWEGRSNAAGEAANSIFTETFGNIRTVRALTLERYFQDKYLRATERAKLVGLKRAAYSGFFFGLSDSGIIFVSAMIFYYGAVLASSKGARTEDILTVFTMLLFSIANANGIIAFVPQINSARDTATRLLRLAKLPYKSSHEHTGHIRLLNPGAIQLTNLSFTYPSRPTASILSSISLTISPHTTTALVGFSGSGKSTIASLILGLYPPTSGKLTISSCRIDTLHLPTVRSLIAIVPQTPVLFSATISQNISYGLSENSPLASLPRIRAAAVLAGIDNFIMSLPCGYDTLIGDGGTGLSGGQAQRIAIARAVVRKPKILVLDEATSGLDPESARHIQGMIGELEKKGVGVLVVTHDREMMKGCREIVVLGDGKVLEKGGFEALLRKQGGHLRKLLGDGHEED